MLHKKVTGIAGTDFETPYGYKNGLLSINDYEPPEGYNPVTRPWYTAAVKTSPEISEGKPYKEIKTKKWLVSVSKTLLDQEGNITGVLAIDTSLERLVKQLWGMSNRNGIWEFC